MRFTVIALLCVMLSYGFAHAELQIVVSGDWTETVDSSDLVSGPGSGLAATYESLSNTSAAAISSTTGDGDAWHVDISRTDGAWDNRLALSARRTSDGSGGGSISGGLSYLEITGSQTFFSGAGNREAINIQYKLTGMSLSVAPGTYGSTVTFTLLDD